MNCDIQTVDKYKYLGLWFNEHLDMTVMANEVARCAHRALGLLLAKVKAAGGIPLDIFTKLYCGCVQPVIDYGAAVWGQRSFSSINAVQNRAMRFFLGVSKSTPNAAIQGELAWKTPIEQQWTVVTRQWCRLINMDTNLLTKKIFIWAGQMANNSCRNWFISSKNQYQNLDLHYMLDTEATINFTHAKNDVSCKMRDRIINNWHQQLHRETAIRGTGANKLRTYRIFKTEYKSEPYLSIIMPWRHKRTLSQFRCGTASLRIETGRYEGLPLNERVCHNCPGIVEDELHVITNCPAYHDLRNELYHYCILNNENFMTISDIDKTCFVLNSTSIAKTTARILFLIMQRRRNMIYH